MSQPAAAGRYLLSVMSHKKNRYLNYELIFQHFHFDQDE